MFRKFLLVLLLLTSSCLFAQSAPSAEGGKLSVWGGAEVSMFNPDWSCTSSSPFSCGANQLLGIAVFADVNRVIGRFGLEGEARWLPWRGPTSNIGQSNYLAGPRFQVFSGERFSANVKVLGGLAVFDQGANAHYTGVWTAFAPGVTVGYKVAQRVMVRGDYEYQRWPGFTGSKGNHGLTPNGFSVGVSYRFL